MTVASTSTDLLAQTEQAILEAVANAGGAVKAAQVIRKVSGVQPPAVVREAYWQLISENRLTRSADGKLSEPA